MSFSLTLPSLMGLGTAPANSTSGEITTGITTAGAAAGATAAIIGATSIIPIIGPVVAGVAALISAFGVGNGCGGTCTEATQVTNQITPLATQMLTACTTTVQQNGCLTAAEQSQAVASIQQLWQQLDQACSQIPAPGGTQCIADRQPGAGGKYDWNVLYINPIMAMPVCAASATPASTAGTAVSDVVSTLTSNPALVAALVVGALILLSNKN